MEVCVKVPDDVIHQMQTRWSDLSRISSIAVIVRPATPDWSAIPPRFRRDFRREESRVLAAKGD